MGQNNFRIGNDRMYERDQFTMTIPEVASEENQDIPHIIQLRINEEVMSLFSGYRDARRNSTHERKHSRRSNGSSGKFFEERHKSDIEEWKKWLQKIKSFFGSSRNGKPTEELQHTNDVSRQPNQEYGKDSAESIEGKIEEVVVTEIQTGTGKEDAGERIEGKDSVREPVEQEIQENKDLVEPSLEMISTEKQPRDPEEVFHDITSIDTTESAGCSSDQEQKWETDIVLEEDIIIPARTEALVNAKLSTKIEGELVVCEPVDIGNGYVHAANCLMVNSTKAWIRVVNVSQKEVKLIKKHKLAKAVSL
ncbi:hypothetical protein JTB14_037314 [Gonioctena quinquepunctata]|nr:hypothetical protein JTB14_037314 [Gonioctena quinquepunctata]